MKRVLFVTVVLVILLSSFSSAFAEEPAAPDQAAPALLGEVKMFQADFGLPFINVDAYLYRPSTLAGWPWVGPDWGTWWWEGPDSSQRRQSWPAYQMTDVWGWYYAEFMLPRDEVWYPCGFPLQWKCNYVVDAFGTIEWHSPYGMAYECRPINPFVDECLSWPWAVEPRDTVSPLQVLLIDQFGWAYVFDFEILGMYWKFSDFE
jgi:hypothetical protein